MLTILPPYVIKYTYNDSSVIVTPSGETVRNVDVDDYKSTIYRGGTPPDENDSSWYREETTGTDAPRYSDAKDTLGIMEDDSTIDIVQERTTDQGEINYQTVTEDSNLAAISANTARFYVKMDYDVSQPNISYYPERENGNTLKFTFDNIDFGIIERPKQSLEVDKQVSHLTITLANGTTLINGDPRTDNLKNVKVLDNHDVYIEIDNELIQGATMTVNYEISVDNTKCEVDYNDENYYIYGTRPDNYEDVFKIARVVDMYDYLPNELLLQTTNDPNNPWEKITVQSTDKGTILSEEVYDKVKGLQNIVHLKTPIFEDMAPNSVKKDNSLVVSRQLSSASDDSLTYENDIEIIKLTGRPPEDSTPGDYDPILNTPDELDDGHVPVTITGPQGENRQYLLYGILGVSALIIIGVGIIIIKKKVL